MKESDHEDVLVARNMVRNIEKQFPGREAEARECLTVVATVRIAIERAVRDGYKKLYPDGIRTKDQCLAEIQHLIEWEEAR
jgi:hypothetical protein